MVPVDQGSMGGAPLQQPKGVPKLQSGWSRAAHCGSSEVGDTSHTNAGAIPVRSSSNITGITSRQRSMYAVAEHKLGGMFHICHMCYSPHDARCLMPPI